MALINQWTVYSSLRSMQYIVNLYILCHYIGYNEPYYQININSQWRTKSMSSRSLVILSTIVPWPKFHCLLIGLCLSPLYSHQVSHPYRSLGKPVNWMLLREHFSRGGILTTEDCISLVKQATEVLKKEPNVLALNDPVTVVGDIHGQFYDLLKILDVGGEIGTVK